jgi:hypothetical protein
MKKITFIFAAMLMILASCNKYNERNFPEDATNYTPRNQVQLTYTLTDADYPNANNRFFTNAFPAKNRVPDLLKTKFVGLDAMSSIMVTYKFLDDVPQEVLNFSDTAYLLTVADYEAIYDDEYSGINGLSPIKSPATVLPEFLLDKFPFAQTGKSKIIEYDFYADVPQSVVYFNEDFENNPDGATNTSVIDIDGWINHDFGTLGRKWDSRAFGGNAYAQFSIFTPIPEGTSDCWMITTEIDLTSATAPELLFDFSVNFFTQASLSVKISSNFNGTTAGVGIAAWDDITSSCGLPTTSHGSGWSAMASTTPANLSAYVGRKIVVALVYKGSNADELTTRYQIDNILVREKPQTPSNPVRTAAAWVFNGTAWAAAPAATTITVQPADYAAMGLGVLMTAAEAPSYLPAFLNLKFPFAQNGRIYTVVYKGLQSLTRADQYVKQNGVWVPVATPVDRAEQYIKIAGGNWIFDPTVVYNMVKNDYQIMVDYVKNLPDKAGFLIGNPPTQELWFGFGSTFNGDVTFQFSVRETVHHIDPQLADAAHAERLVIKWERLKEGMRIFCELKFPDAVQFVEGIQMHYKVRVAIFRPDGVTGSATYEYTYKCTGNGKFEYVSHTLL